jgi:hypothetical protein
VRCAALSCGTRSNHLDAAVVAVDVHEGRHAHRPPGVRGENGKGHHAARREQTETAVDLRGHPIWRGDCCVPELPQFTVPNGFAEIVVMVMGQGLEYDVTACQRHGRNK